MPQTSPIPCECGARTLREKAALRVLMLDRSWLFLPVFAIGVVFVLGFWTGRASVDTSRIDAEKVARLTTYLEEARTHPANRFPPRIRNEP